MPIDANVVERLYRRAHAERWRVPVDRFAEALERSAERGADPAKLHLEDLALACGCAGGDDAAWELFIREHRPVLYRAADALDPGGGARDLADSIYGDLFERSLFRYFHGRSSLATWLRAVLAQRHVDRVRTQRRLEPLPEDDSAGVGGPAAAGPYGTPGTAEAGPHEPQWRRCLQLIQASLTRAVATLPPRDRLRLACYYAQELTLAETGKLLGEHEATCSRHLARTRKTLRADIERRLRTEGGLSGPEIAECFASVSEDPGELDLRQLLGGSGMTSSPSPELRKESPVDRSTARESVNCLDAETLAAWMDGGLTGAALEDVRTHVGGCDRCQMLLGAMGATRSAVPPLETQRAPRRWLAWAVPLTAAAAAIAIWVAIPEQRNARVGPPPAMPTQKQEAAPSAPPAAPAPAAAEPKEETARRAGPPPPAASAASKELRTEQFRAQAAEPPAAPQPGTADAGRLAPNSVNEAVTLAAPAGARVVPLCGAEWTSPPAAVAGQLTAGSGPSTDVCWVVGRAGTVLLSTDKRTWQRLIFPEMTDLSGVQGSDARSATVSTTDGRTFSTSDGGATWVRQ